MDKGNKEGDGDGGEFGDSDNDILNKMDRESEEAKGNLDSELKIQIDKQKIQIISKDQFNEHLQAKLDKLGNRLIILQIKYQGYKSWYDKFNIMIIIISSILSIFESFRNEMVDAVEGDKILEICFNMIPICISSIITCSAVIIKFKKYQEKMENMQFTREKVILSMSKIKHIQEMTWFSNEDNFEGIKKKYLDDIYSFYIESTSEIERHIKYTDHFKLNNMKSDKSDK